MSRNNYDDMPTRYERSRNSSRKTGLVAFLGVLITLVIIVVFLIMSPEEEKSGEAEKTIDNAVSIIAPVVAPEPQAEPSPSLVVEEEPLAAETSIAPEPVDREVVTIVLDDIVPIEMSFEEPIVEQSIPEEPIEELVVEEPVVEEALVEESPVDIVVEEPIVEEVSAEPVIEEIPVVVIEEPVVEEIPLEVVVEEPIVEEVPVEVVPEEPVTEEIVEEAIEIVEEPVEIIEPVVEEVPVVEEIVEEIIPVVEEPEVEVIPFVEEEPKVVIPLAAFPIDNDILTMKTYVVNDEDNLYSIAESFNLDPATIVSVNELSNVDSISSSDILFIPNMDGKIYVLKEGDDVNTLYARFNPGCTEKELLKMNLLDDRELEVGMKIFLPKSLSSVDEGFEPFFSIPIEGEIVASYGETYKTRVLDGIIVEGYSTKVISPLDGVVEQAGRSYNNGKYVVIAHENGYKTGYYGLETVDLRKGMEVSEGDVIGSISANGIFGRFSILFKVEQDGVAMDPELFL